MSLRLYRFDITAVQLQTITVYASTEHQARCLVSMAAAGDTMAAEKVTFHETRTLGGMCEYPARSADVQSEPHRVAALEKQKVRLVGAEIDLEFEGEGNHG